MTDVDESRAERRIWDALREVVDPEIGINIVDLGLVYSVELDGRDVRIVMTMTTEACPLHAYLAETAERTLRQHCPDLDRVVVDVIWEPPWSPRMMSESARRQLGWTD